MAEKRMAHPGCAGSVPEVFPSRKAVEAAGGEVIVRDLARDLFARKVAMGACLSKTADSIAAACFEEARAFVAVAKAQDRLSSEV